MFCLFCSPEFWSCCSLNCCVFCYPECFSLFYPMVLSLFSGCFVVLSGISFSNKNCLSFVSGNIVFFCLQIFCHWKCVLRKFSFFSRMFVFFSPECLSFLSPEIMSVFLSFVFSPESLSLFFSRKFVFFVACLWKNVTGIGCKRQGSAELPKRVPGGS